MRAGSGTRRRSGSRRGRRKKGPRREQAGAGRRRDRAASEGVPRRPGWKAAVSGRAERTRAGASGEPGAGRGVSRLGRKWAGPGCVRGLPRRGRAERARAVLRVSREQAGAWGRKAEVSDRVQMVEGPRRSGRANEWIKGKRPRKGRFSSFLWVGRVAGGRVAGRSRGRVDVSAPRSAARYSWVACHHAVCCLVRVASLVLGSEVVMPEKVRIAFAPLDIE